MNRKLLLSIRPKHLVNILNGKKTLELRKSVPKDFVGWTYLYATKNNDNLIYNGREYTIEKGKRSDYNLNCKVVARFYLDEKYTKYVFDEYLGGYLDETKTIMLYEDKEELNKLCLTYEEIREYGREKDLYACHIKKLEIFDRPKELSDFGLTKAPQSYQYVYVKE